MGLAKLITLGIIGEWTKPRNKLHGYVTSLGILQYEQLYLGSFFKIKV